LAENTSTNVKPTFESILQENQKLKQMLLTAKKSIEEHREAAKQEKSLNEKLSSRVASIEMERRKERIATILQGAYKEEDTAAKIDSLAKSGLPFEEIQNIVNPLVEMRNAVQEQAKTAEINEKAEELAKTKSASIPNTKSQSSKVAIKNATVPEEERTEVPAWAIVSGGIA
jgi:hypothetical protein